MDTRYFGVLTDETRRRVLEILDGSPAAVSEQDLAERLAVRAGSSESGAETSDVAASLRVRLYHVHLPKLADHGIVDWDREEETVAATDHPVYDAAELDEPVETGDHESVVSPRAADRRLDVLSVVESADGPVTREDIANKLASREADGQPETTRVEELTINLHHRHLPKLSADGLVDYDPDTGIVACSDHD